VLLKAAAGGGGKGMRIVELESDIEQNLERARSEALGAFGDDRVYIEKYIVSPRHIEFQVLADRHGNVIHLGERECSIQRRHQKLVEESPSPAVTPELRKEMGEAAVSLVREAKYEGAGTVEFLVDGNGKYYFLEVNTRLQVEHPITECVTGLDLVREQFSIAEGNKLRYQQSDITNCGHAIELRIQAEDIWNDFLPSLGTVTYVRQAGGAFVRNDSALFAGLEVSPYYDSLLAKLIVWDRTRTTAIDRLRRAIAETRIVGVATTLPFGAFVMNNRRFASGDLSTSFIEEEFSADARSAYSDQLLASRKLAFAAVSQEIQKQKTREQFLAK
jgi:acetyl/propionyl-CoA carboxylase alpha subunit